MRSALSLVLLLAAIVGCTARNPEPGNPPEAAEAAAANLTGPVVEQMAASPYIYLRIRTSQGEVWAAVPEANVETGSVVTVANPMLMTQFASPSLNRTFDEIWFGTLAGEGGEMAATAGNPHAGVPQSAATVEAGQVEKAAGADARTVAEVWAQQAGLEGKTVAIRGVVVKVNNGVMGKNWIHLQDGSGDASAGTNDITVTTQEQIARGTTVTIRGTVRTNRDLGAGYVYAVLVEDAATVRP